MSKTSGMGIVNCGLATESCTGTGTVSITAGKTQKHETKDKRILQFAYRPNDEMCSLNCQTPICNLYYL